MWKPRKVVVVGAGAVGSTFAFALAQSGMADEIVLLDKNQRLVEGQVLDLSHGEPFFPPVNIRVGDSRDYTDAHVIVMTAGAKQRPGETRLQLIRANRSIVEQVVDDIVSFQSEAVLLMVTNPVDPLTYIAAKKAGWPRGRVFGSGTVLDTARLRQFLAHQLQVDVHNIHAYVLGEHGDSQFVAWSLAHVAGMSVEEHCPLCGIGDLTAPTRQQIEDAVRNSAYHIIDYKGATHFAVALALVRIVGSILRNERNILPVSTLLQGEYGLTDVCLSVPCVVTERGVERVVEARLTARERAALFRSAATIKKALAELA